MSYFDSKMPNHLCLTQSHTNKQKKTHTKKIFKIPSATHLCGFLEVGVLVRRSVRVDSVLAQHGAIHGTQAAQTALVADGHQVRTHRALQLYFLERFRTWY